MILKAERNFMRMFSYLENFMQGIAGGGRGGGGGGGQRGQLPPPGKLNFFSNMVFELLSYFL